MWRNTALLFCYNEKKMSMFLAVQQLTRKNVVAVHLQFYETFICCSHYKIVVCAGSTTLWQLYDKESQLTVASEQTAVS